MTLDPSREALIASRPAGRPFPWPCPRCRTKTVWPTILAYRSTINHDGQLHVIETPQLNVPRCEVCGELMFDNWAEDQIDQALRVQLHLLSPEQIRANRTALGLSAGELAARIGVSEELLTGWEEQRRIQARVEDNLLRLYFGLPQVRSALDGAPAHPDLGVAVVP